MAKTAVKERLHTPEEYLIREERAAYKSEYINGEIFAMAGGSLKHSQICFNLIRQIGDAIAHKDCIGLESNVKVEIQRGRQYFYPDAMVVCGTVEFAQNRADTIKNPMLIVEILSPATEAFDRNKKFAAYRTLPSLREYVLVYQEEPQIEAFFKEDEKTWRYTVARGLEDTIRLLSLDCDFALRDIYQKVEWEQPAEELSGAQ
jgi:Uma2 family endonuclease